MNSRHFVRVAAAIALFAIPAAALAAPDQNSNQNYPNNGQNQCAQWNNNGQCVRWNNGNWNNNNNGNWNNGRRRDRDNGDDRDDNQGRHHGWYNGNNGNYNNGSYNNGNWNNNGGYQGRNGTLGGTVSSFSPYNLYLNNGTHVQLHDGTVINPTGINLTGGQRVRIYGNWNGNTFNADEIDVIGNGYYRR